jgi:hypothetical protein
LVVVVVAHLDMEVVVVVEVLLRQRVLQFLESSA